MMYIMYIINLAKAILFVNMAILSTALVCLILYLLYDLSKKTIYD